MELEQWERWGVGARRVSGKGGDIDGALAMAGSEGLGEDWRSCTLYTACCSYQNISGEMLGQTVASSWHL